MKRILMSALGAALLLSVSMSGPAFADHNEVNGEVAIFRGTTVVASFSDWVECADDDCSIIFLHVGKREHNRFVRWCGTWEYLITIPAGSHGKIETCPGGGDWSIQVSASLDSVNNLPLTHPDPVYLHIYVVAGAWGAG